MIVVVFFFFFQLIKSNATGMFRGMNHISWVTEGTREQNIREERASGKVGSVF